MILDLLIIVIIFLVVIFKLQFQIKPLLLRFSS